ncbi:16S rRNA (guanine(527)-N(7))-methyltransferase RsmG [Telmatospirillum siberiense]|uniref:Ribosomal RNA small subunit methyltransferase G n=1 Tax=Telmatospirillum siberiense TaxID=382514 RepID=A0A2N3PMZ9_9PROT|nr:16S rRNA (guanine(527)-N(7))-methyltransferase RsmG [Telmatospirillum siberiense]PKU21777.1 16S rRNA (guanine(527)-N(7))-methyltransferase RsmG [Telmatospirillum siberiense]
MTRADFARRIPVTPDVLDRLQRYADLLVKWQARINLVGPSTIPALWERHMLDSAQLTAHLPSGPVLDLGSGAGFPGLVLAIMRGGPVHLVESDVRKCAFLREAARLTEADAVVHNVRIETLAPFPVAAITARALAPLAKLLEMAENFLHPAVHCLFLKGRGGEEELTDARKDWMMTLERIPSLADSSGQILHLREVHRGRDER